VAICRVCGTGETVEVWRSYRGPSALDACAHCLAIQRRAPESAIEIDGAIVLRTRDRLLDLSEDDLRAEVERLAEDDALFVLLRVPQVFELARVLIGDRGRLARPAEHGFRQLPDDAAVREAMRPVGEGTAEERRRALEELRARPAPPPGPPVALERYERIRFDGDLPRSRPAADLAGIRAVLGRGETFRVTGVRDATFEITRGDRFGTHRYYAPLDLLF
jgi:hypothetical protein